MQVPVMKDGEEDFFADFVLFEDELLLRNITVWPLLEKETCLYLFLG